MTPEAINKAAEHLVKARLDGPPTGPLPDEFAPGDESEGYAIQSRVHEILSAVRFGPIVGHKIGCTTPVMQKFLNIDHPCAGGVFESTVHRGSAELKLADFHRVGIECEIAAKLRYDLPDIGAPYTRDAVEWTIDSLMAGIEVIDDRYQDYTILPAATLIADDFFNSAVVLSQPQALFRFFDLSVAKGTVWIDGDLRGTGSGADIMGHPFEALAWLANHRVSVGKPLKAGEFVMLGSVVQTVFIEEPSLVQVEIRGIGRTEVRFV